jgi:hypothetical protein
VIGDPGAQYSRTFLRRTAAMTAVGTSGTSEGVRLDSAKRSKPTLLGRVLTNAQIAADYALILRLRYGQPTLTVVQKNCNPHTSFAAASDCRTIAIYEYTPLAPWSSPYWPTATCSKGLGAASLLMVAWLTP